MSGGFSTFELIGLVLAIWTLLSVATALLAIPWFRAHARVNDGLALRERRAGWCAAASPGIARQITRR